MLKVMRSPGPRVQLPNAAMVETAGQVAEKAGMAATKAMTVNIATVSPGLVLLRFVAGRTSLFMDSLSVIGFHATN